MLSNSNKTGTDYSPFDANLSQNNSTTNDHNSNNISDLNELNIFSDNCYSEAEKLQNYPENYTISNSLQKLIIDLLIKSSQKISIESLIGFVVNQSASLIDADKCAAFTLMSNNEPSLQALYNYPEGTATASLPHTVKALCKKVFEKKTEITHTQSEVDTSIIDDDVILTEKFIYHFFIPLDLNNHRYVIYYETKLSSVEQSQIVNSLLNNLIQFVISLFKSEKISKGKLSDSSPFKTVFEKAPIGLIVIDNKADIIDINRSAMEILDINFENIKNKNINNLFEIFPEKEKTQWQYMITSSLTSYETFEEPRYFHDTGYMEKVLSLKLTPVIDFTEYGKGLIIFIEDVTEKTITEKYVILSEKLAERSDLTNSMGHKLNNFLTVLSNNMSLLSRHIDNEEFEKAKFNTRAVNDSLLKLQMYVSSLADLSQPETEFISFDVKRLIEDTLFSLKNQSRFKQIHFTIDINQDIPNLEMDVSQIKQLLIILLENAADAVQEKAISNDANQQSYNQQITIYSDVDSKTEEIIIEICDNGVGISEELLHKIYLLHFSTKKKGNGLGLFNAKKIASQHHGNISVDTTLGQGTCFKIKLPRFQPRASEDIIVQK